VKFLEKEEVQLPVGWPLDSSFRGGVDKRVGWWMEIPFGWKAHFYVVLFRDGTRGPATMGTNPWVKIKS
jgi:hypothetical protein